MDVLRLLALAQMINGHTLDAVVVTSIRDAPAYYYYSYVRGLVSVAFMVAAGFSYHLTTIARFDQYKADAALRKKRLTRGLLLVFTSYALQWRLDLHWGGPGALRSLEYFLRVDVLACVGFAILVQELVMRTSRSMRQVHFTLAALAALVLVLAPLGEAASRPGPWSALTNWLGHRGGSLFPALPWAGFVWAGAAIAGFAMPEGTKTAASFPWPRLVALGLLAFAIRKVLFELPYTLVEPDASYASRPAYVIGKLGTVLLATAALSFALQRVRRLPSWMVTISGETLAIYIFHLLVLFRFPWSPSRAFPHTLSLAEGLAIVAAMAVACTFVGLYWRSWRVVRDALFAPVRDRLARWVPRLGQP